MRTSTKRPHLEDEAGQAYLSMMRHLIVLAALLATPALGQDRFAPDNPWFKDFEAACRAELTMDEECQAGVLGAYAERAGTQNIACDFAAFWRVRDEQYPDSKVFAVLPWQTAVEFIVAEPGVCSVR
jgi:hypothetical protein